MAVSHQVWLQAALKLRIFFFYPHLYWAQVIRKIFESIFFSSKKLKASLTIDFSAVTGWNCILLRCGRLWYTVGIIFYFFSQQQQQLRRCDKVALLIVASISFYNKPIPIIIRHSSEVALSVSSTVIPSTKQLRHTWLSWSQNTSHTERINDCFYPCQMKGLDLVTFNVLFWFFFSKGLSSGGKQKWSWIQTASMETKGHRWRFKGQKDEEMLLLSMDEWSLHWSHSSVGAFPALSSSSQTLNEGKLLGEK